MRNIVMHILAVALEGRQEGLNPQLKNAGAQPLQNKSDTLI